MASIDLGKGLACLVDDMDLEFLSSFKWHCLKVGKDLRYAADSHMKYMHRLIMDAKDGERVDHIDGDGLNNRRSNLRVATHAQNMKNRRRHRNNTSGFKGVSFISAHGKYRAEIYCDGTRIDLGYHPSAEAAHAAYCEAARKYHGEFARLR